MIAILYPFKMDKNLSEAYSTIYESSLTSGSSGGNYHDVGGGDYRSTDQLVRMNNDPKGTKKYGSKMMKKVGNTMNDLKIPTVRKKNESLEPEGEIVEGKKDLPKTKMYRKAGNLSRKALSQGLDSEEGSKAQKRSEKIVSTISTADEKKRFDNMKTKKSELYNDTTGKFRQEWEALKLIETENHREKFDTWLEGIAEEGYDIDRWTDEELVDTFINENDLWDSRESVETALFESDKKGKGSGKKDACYHKVKASASVWPSAYASGRLVQCRKKGAANYGKSKKEDFSDWRSDLQLDELNKQERMETAKRGGGGVGKRFAKKTLGANRAGKGKLFGGYDHRGIGNVGRRNINRFETKPVEREDGSLEKGTRKQSFKKVKVLNPVKKGGRTLNKFGSDVQHDYVSKDGLRTQSSDHAQKQRRKEHEKRRGVKTKGTVTSDIKKALKDDYSYVNDVYLESVKNYGKNVSIPLPNIKALGPLNPRNFKINAVGPEKDGGLSKNPIKGSINRLGYTDQGKSNKVIQNVEKAKKVIPSAMSKVDKLNKMADKLPNKVKTAAKIGLGAGAAVLGAKALMDRNKKKREEKRITKEVRKQMAYAHHEPEGEMIDEKVGGKGTLVRQGIKLFGKKGGRQVQKGQAAALAAGQGAKDAAKQPNKDKMVGSGTGEKIGSVVGTVGGSLAGGVVDGPLPFGDIAGGIAGGALGGKIGRQFDKMGAKKNQLKPA